MIYKKELKNIFLQTFWNTNCSQINPNGETVPYLPTKI